MIAVQRIDNWEESSRQLILQSGFKIVDLVWESNVDLSW